MSQESQGEKSNMLQTVKKKYKSINETAFFWIKETFLKKVGNRKQTYPTPVVTKNHILKTNVIVEAKRVDVFKLFFILVLD